MWHDRVTRKLIKWVVQTAPKTAIHTKIRTLKYDAFNIKYIHTGK